MITDYKSQKFSVLRMNLVRNVNKKTHTTFLKMFWLLLIISYRCSFCSSFITRGTETLTGRGFIYLYLYIKIYNLIY